MRGVEVRGLLPLRGVDALGCWGWLIGGGGDMSGGGTPPDNERTANKY